MKEIKYHRDVLLYLDELFDVLIEKDYFSFYEPSAQYIEDLVTFVAQQIDNLPHRTAPDYFSQYSPNMFYISYSRNKRTTWYIFFQKTAHYYYIRYITNNHKEGQYIG